MGVFGTLAAVGMAVGPPLVYADQLRSIVKRRDSTGFSHDVCGILIVANIARIFFWIGERFETTLLIQSILMLCAQIGLLFVCLRYRHYDASEWPQGRDEADEGPSAERHLLRKLASGGTPARRPFQLWQWSGFGTYIEFIAGVILANGLLVLFLQSYAWFWTGLGFFATGLEATALINQRRKSLSGFSLVVLGGWAFGDAFKLVFFILRSAPIQFTACAIFQLSIDLLIAAQAYAFRHNTRLENEQTETVAVREEAPALLRAAAHGDVNA